MIKKRRNNLVKDIRLSLNNDNYLLFFYLLFNYIYFFLIIYYGNLHIVSQQNIKDNQIFLFVVAFLETYNRKSIVSLIKFKKRVTEIVFWFKGKKLLSEHQ